MATTGKITAILHVVNLKESGFSIEINDKAVVFPVIARKCLTQQYFDYMGYIFNWLGGILNAGSWPVLVPERSWLG